MKAENKAAVAALAAVWTADQVHEVGEVPDAPTVPYAAVFVTSGMGAAYRLSADAGARSYRIVVQVAGKYAADVAFGVEKADAAFFGQRLTVSGYDTTPAEAEASSPIIRDPDAGGLLTCTVTYTFAAFPTVAA